MPGIFSNAKLNFNTGGGPKKAGLVNSWNWPSIPYKFLPRTITATAIQEIIDYLLGLLTDLFGNPTDAATADVAVLEFVMFGKELGEAAFTNGQSVGTDWTITNNALTSTGAFPATFWFGGDLPDNAGNVAAFRTKTNARIGKVSVTTKKEVALTAAASYAEQGFIEIAANQPGIDAGFMAQLMALDTEVTGLAGLATFLDGTYSAGVKAAIASGDAAAVIAASPFAALPGTEKAIVTQLAQDIIDATS
jgi:hypothetical protein